MKSIITLVVSLACSLIWAEAKNYPWDVEMKGPQSVYTDALVELVRHGLPRPPPDLPGESPIIQANCLETPKNEFYVGVEQHMIVNSAIPRIDTAISDFASYPKLFPGLKHVEVRSQDKNLWVIGFEQHIPVFFIPNVHYEMYYLFDRSQSNRVLVRYKLKEKTKIKLSDGIILLEKISENKTRYTEYDFFDADYGMLKTFAPGSIWESSVHDLLLSDLVIKVRAENPELNHASVLEKAKSLLEGIPINEIAKKRKRFVVPSIEKVPK